MERKEPINFVRLNREVVMFQKEPPLCCPSQSFLAVVSQLGSSDPIKGQLASESTCFLLILPLVRKSMASGYLWAGTGPT